MQPLVSLVVPVFNGMPHLEQLAECLVSQTYPNVEIIFTEGGGTDSSAEFLQSLDDPRIRFLQMPSGTSAADNWTAASMEARGDFTKLVCQDDLLYPQALENQVGDLLQHPSAVMAIAQRDIVDARGSTLFSGRGLAGLPKNRDVIAGSEVIRACYLQGTNVLGEPLSVLFRTEALRAAMPWDDTDPLMLDLSTYQKVAPHGDIVLRRESIGAFRVSDSSWSTRLAKEQLDQTRRWQEAYRSSSTPPPTALQRGRALVGRHASTNLRRLAYTTLRLKGSLKSAGPPA